MLLIGICGASGSGKSTLARALKDALDSRCLILAQDAYYRDRREMTFEQRCALNYDSPDMFEHDALLADIVTLTRGEPITRKQYDYSRHCRADSDGLIYPADVVILEGIHSFYDERLRELMFLKLYMKVDPDECLLRRINRDIRERGRDIVSVSDQYRETVKPMYEKYIRSYEQYADVIVANGGHNARIVNILAEYVNSKM